MPAERVEDAVAVMLDLFPEGFAEARMADSVELTAFTDETGADSLRTAFGDLRVEPVPAGWEDEWKQFHRPVEIGSLWVGPPWEEPSPGLVPVTIDPGRAFGTGAHPTTQLCLDLLQQLEGGSLVDLGCGSGVIAIAAALLGYFPVTALDLDEAAVEATTRNAEANGVEIEVARHDLRRAPTPEADVAVANLDLPTISVLRPTSASLIASGYQAVDRPGVEGFQHVARRTLDGWAADLFRRE